MSTEELAEGLDQRGVRIARPLDRATPRFSMATTSSLVTVYSVVKNTWYCVGCFL